MFVESKLGTINSSTWVVIYAACSQCLHESLTAFPGDPQGRIGHLLFIDTVALFGRDRDTPSSMFNSPKVSVHTHPGSLE
jgi:hypothetical protein